MTCGLSGRGACSGPSSGVSCRLPGPRAGASATRHITCGLSRSSRRAGCACGVSGRLLRCCTRASAGGRMTRGLSRCSCRAGCACGMSGRLPGPWAGASATRRITCGLSRSSRRAGCARSVSGRLAGSSCGPRGSRCRDRRLARTRCRGCRSRGMSSARRIVVGVLALQVWGRDDLAFAVTAGPATTMPVLTLSGIEGHYLIRGTTLDRGEDIRLTGRFGHRRSGRQSTSRNHCKRCGRRMIRRSPGHIPIRRATAKDKKARKQKSRKFQRPRGL
jgi:hypothetical protein